MSVDLNHAGNPTPGFPAPGYLQNPPQETVLQSVDGGGPNNELTDDQKNRLISEKSHQQPKVPAAKYHRLSFTAENRHLYIGAAACRNPVPKVYKI
jgi:hypothetical protein